MKDKILEQYEKMLAGEGIITEGAGLTRKHFVAIAAMMKNASTLDELKNDLFNWCLEMNPQFDSERFKKAAGMK